MIRKILFGFCGMLTCFMLLGCGTASSQQATTLRISALDGGYGKKGWQEVIKRFEDKENVKIELTIDNKIADQLKKDLENDQLPDLIYLSVGSDGGFTDQMIYQNKIANIDDILTQSVYGESTTVEDKLLKNITNSFQMRPYQDQKLYLAPVNYGPCGLFYNAGLLKEKGWKLPTTWEEMWELGDKAKAEGISLFTYPTSGYFDAFFSALLNETAGEEAFKKAMSYDLATWQSDDVKRAFEIIGKLSEYTSLETVENANSDHYKNNQQMILNNQAIFCPNGKWLPAEMKDAPKAEGFEWGFCALPKLSEDSNSYASIFTEQVYIPKDSQNKEIAKKFITYLYSDEAVEIFYKNGGAIVPIKNVFSMIPSEDKENRMLYSIYDTGVKANSVGFMGNEQGDNRLSDPNEGVLYGEINAVMSKKMSVQEWYKKVIEEIKTIAKENQ